MATALHTARLLLCPFLRQDLDRFVTEMLTDPHVAKSYMYTYHPRPADAVIH